MTREEVIHILEKIKYCCNAYEVDKALSMAIKALEQDTILDKIKADIEQLPTTKCTETHKIYIIADDFKENVLAILDKYKAESEDKE